MLTRKIEELDEQYEAPRKAYIEELERKTAENSSLDRQLSEKQKDLVSAMAEIERFKIAIKGLNQKISDLQLEHSQLKEKLQQRESDSDIVKLRENLDFEKNMNQSQKLTIERL